MVTMWNVNAFQRLGTYKVAIITTIIIRYKISESISSLPFILMISARVSSVHCIHTTVHVIGYSDDILRQRQWFWESLMGGYGLYTTIIWLHIVLWTFHANVPSWGLTGYWIGGFPLVFPGWFILVCREKKKKLTFKTIIDYKSLWPWKGWG